MYKSCGLVDSAVFCQNPWLNYRQIGSCILKAFVARCFTCINRHVDQVSVDISADMSTDSCPSVGQHVVQVGRPSVATIS